MFMSHFAFTRRSVQVRSSIFLRTLLIGFLLCGPFFLQLTGAEEVHYSEGFEKKDPVVFWTNGGKGTYKVNFKGLTSEKSRSGKKSFKLDITFIEGGYYSYWGGPTLDIPVVPGMKMTGYIYVKRAPEASATLGIGIYSPAEALMSGGSGRGACHTIRSLRRSEMGKWIRLDSDLNLAAKSMSKAPGVKLDKWYISITGNLDKNARLVIYLDDISVEGTVPEGWEEKSKKEIHEWVSTAKNKKNKELQAYEKRLVPVRNMVKRAIQKIPGDAILKRIPEKPWGNYAKDLLQQMNAKAEELSKATALGYKEVPTVPIPVSDKPGEYLRNIKDSGISPIKTSIQNLKKLGGRKDPYLIFVQDNPLSNYRILPDTKMINGVIGNELSLFASPGEYEPGSFVLLPAKTTTVTFELSDLKSGNNVIDKSSLDLKLVKVWYQGGINHNPSGKSYLTPELLLNDDSLVRLDEKKERNIVRDIDSPKDAPKLLPVSISAMTAKQFWLTVHTPDDAKAGTYTGTITITAAGLGEKVLNVNLRVLPIKLAEPEYEYSIYYRGIIKDGSPEYVSSEQKTLEQLAAEFQNMKAHGITNPDVYQKFDKNFAKYMEIRKQAGLKIGPLYFLGISAGNPSSEEELQEHLKLLRRFLAWAKDNGIDDVYFQGSDEARGEELKAQRKMWEALHGIGGKVFVACSTGFFELVGDLLDLPIVARESKQDVERVHALGYKIFYYSNPAGAIEQPYTFRYRFGHWLDRSGMDGVQTYVYQHGMGAGKSMGRMWDDFDFAKYRTLAFTYPTVDGVVDTLQWEGVREGVDDVRYLSTLRMAIAKAKESTNSKTVELAKDTEKWLATLNVEGNLQKLRYKIAEKILAIQDTLSLQSKP